MTRGRPILFLVAVVGTMTVATDRDAGAQDREVGPLRLLVVDTQREPVPEIAVHVIAPDQPRRTYTTDHAGTALIPGNLVVEGAVISAFRGREAMAWFSLNETPLPGRAGLRARMMLLPLKHRVEGSVIDREGKPIAGARIGVERLNHPTNRILNQDMRSKEPLLGFVVTDNAGKFTMTLPRDTRARLKAMHVRAIGRAIEVPANAMTLSPMTMEPAGGIAGRLSLAAAGKPVAGASVAAQLIEAHQRSLTDGWGQAATDDQGRFAIGGLEPGVYNVLLLEIPGREQAAARSVEGVRVRAGDDATAELTVIEGRPLSGVVIDRETDRPMVDAMVGCQGPALPRSGTAIMGTKTDGQGRFTFHVPPGEQFVNLIDDPTSLWMSRRVVVVPEQGEVPPIFLLRPRGASSFSSTPAEESAAVAAPASVGGTTSSTTMTRVANAAKAPTAKVRTVAGRINDPQGRPLTGIRVTVEGDPIRFDTVATDREGRFVLGGLPHQRVAIALGRSGESIQKETLPDDRDEATLTYRPVPDEKVRKSAARVEDEPVPPEIRGRLTLVDLTPFGNNFLADGPGASSDGNHLDRVSRGVRKLGGVYFRIGEKLIQVKGQVVLHWPESVTGIKVGARGKTLHFLHATEQQAEFGTELGHYAIHYADGSREKIPIVYGRDLVNWWHFRVEKNDPAQAKIAWTGTNHMSDQRRGENLSVRLYAVTWTNPHPDREIAAIDIVSSVSACDPFLIAVTLEREGE